MPPWAKFRKKYFFCENIYGTSIFSALRTRQCFHWEEKGLRVAFHSHRRWTSWASPGPHWRTTFNIALKLGGGESSIWSVHSNFISKIINWNHFRMQRRISQDIVLFLFYKITLFNCNYNYPSPTICIISITPFLHNLNRGKCKFHKDTKTWKRCAFFASDILDLAFSNLILWKSNYI